ncbi:GGDEF domain-containing protein [Croceibacterium sp. LX-88]|uniref:diguanylate cyclase n=1 Tax=Croceibacterium selenioxidans TaxID=2838833 RepID=A0ABS5W3D7_9SPHN|nr:GGDEF domain-containing protein [Croceibacterium selenioxidans]MBT2134271.1 GGDEF domain-containing protein [Croceibacterium selenioxidans]
MSERPHEIAEETIAFLRHHLLDPTPQNYTLCFAAHSGAHPALHKALAAISDDGIRVTQKDADELFAQFLTALPPGLTNDEPDFARALRHQALKITDAVNDAAVVAGAFNLELSSDYDRLKTDPANVATILATMLDRSRKAENELAAAMAELQTLRTELEAAREDSNRDAVTNLHNRRALLAHLAELAEAKRDHVLAICDVDHFKSVNDTYGHVVGDRVLKSIGNALSTACAPHVVGRWGGEEFLVILSDTELSDAKRIIEEAREHVAGTRYKLRATDEPIGTITFSAGLVCVNDTDNGAQEAIIRADELLYRAKSEGRNRSIAA